MAHSSSRWADLIFVDGNVRQCRQTSRRHQSFAVTLMRTQVDGSGPPRKIGNWKMSLTHAILLPHSAAYNAQAAANELQPLADLFGGAIGSGLYDFAKSLGAPLALKDLGLQEAQLDAAADLAVKNPYWNPRPVERDAVRSLLQRAWEGARPQ